MSWSYADNWNWLTEAPLDPIDAAEAARRHAAGEPYSAIEVGLDGLHVLVEVALEDGVVKVTFPDDRGRRELVYSFQQTGAQLFMTEMYAYDYGDSTDRGDYAEAEEVDIVTFTPEGTGRWVTEDAEGNGTLEERDQLDVSLQWESIPAFGDYTSIIRRDRDEPA